MTFFHQTSKNTLHLGKRALASHTVEACMLPVLVILSGLLTGLTLAYFSVDYTKLRVIVICGQPRQQVHARRIMSLRNNPYHLLTTLSLFNAISIASISVVTQGLIPNHLYSALISTATILLSTAIIPPSICTRYAFQVAGRLSRGVQFLTCASSPVTWPVAKLLEWTVGDWAPPRFCRTELRELVRQHTTEANGDLDSCTSQITWNALTLSSYTAHSAMVPIDKVVMIPLGGQLDYKAFSDIQEAGWSRIVVYTKEEGSRTILGYILSKNLILENPQTCTPVDKQILYDLPLVSSQEPLTNVLQALLGRQQHMALVYHPQSASSDEDSSAHWPTWKGRLMLKIANLFRVRGNGVEDVEKANTPGCRSTESVNTYRFDTNTPRRQGGTAPRAQVEPIGIITLEDIMEKLLGEKIWEETDWSSSPRYPRTLLSNHHTRVSSLPSRSIGYRASTEYVAKARPTSSHYPCMATVEESNSNSTSSYRTVGIITHLLKNEDQNNGGESCSTESISTQGSDRHSALKSFHPHGQEGMTGVHAPKFEQLPKAKSFTTRLERSRSSRRCSHHHVDLTRLESHYSESLVRQRLGLGGCPPLLAPGR